MYRYCVAEVTLLGEQPEVTYYAYFQNAYGLCLVPNIDEEHILWYDTEKEALGHRWNACDCVIMKYFEK